MHRRYGPLILFTAVIGLSSVYFGYMAFNAAGLPFGVLVVGARSGVIVPMPGVTMPARLNAGERLDLAAQPRATRIAIVQLNSNGQQLLPGTDYRFVTDAGAAAPAVVVRSANLESVSSERVEGWLELFESMVSGVIALVLVWRGRDRAAMGLALFATAFLAGRAVTSIPCQGTPGLVALTSAWVLYLIARGGFYVMAEAIAGASLSARTRFWWRAGFLALLGGGAIVAVGGPLLFVSYGWAGLLQPGFGSVLTASYLVPIALLFVSYRRAEISQRLRLRWMLTSGGVFALGITLSNVSIPGFVGQANATEILQLGAWGGFLYAILRHRVVDLRVVVSRTLVYAMTTSLVLGFFALLESLIERAALGHDASLALELAVPLGLGVSLSAVHRRVDDTVDRLIFRRQYREEVELRRFASENAFVTRPETLLDLTVDQIRSHVGAPWVAYYEYTPEGYTRVRQRGAQELPQFVATDDLALVKLRAYDDDVDLHESPSGLGRDGYAFPLRARDRLLGVLVVGPRPGEHYAAEERELMAHVARSVGASLFALTRVPGVVR